MRGTIIAVLFLGLAAPAFGRDLSVSAGGTVRLDGWAHFNSRCETTGYARYRLAGRSRLGVLVTRRETWAITRIGDPRTRANCAGKRFPGVRAYFPAGRRKGTEDLTLVRVDRRGRPKRLRFTITVR